MKRFVLHIALILTTATMLAQGNGPTIGANLQMTIPQNNFAENYRGLPIGIGAHIAIPSGNRSPIEIGMDLAWSTMGSDRDQVTFEDGLQNLLAGDLSVKSNVNSYHAFARFSPFNGPARIYVDGYAGFRNFTTKSVFEYQDVEGFTLQQIDVASKNLSFSYGWGGGIMLSLNRNLMFDAGFQKLKGGNATYLDRNSIVINPDGSTSFDIITSKTDVVIPKVGLTLAF
ncbi:MAG: hypothetical protein AAF487_09710 [Bacteroidota bacterium]